MSDKVSIIIPAYRTKESFLSQAVESVLAQTYSDFELLIVDDCPVQPVKNIINKYNDPRIKYLPNLVNLGMADSRNVGIALASGKYIAMLDHDDFFKPNKLELMVEFMSKNPECVLVYTLVEFSNGEEQRAYSKNTLGAMLKRSDIHSCSAIMFRKSFVIEQKIKFNRHYEPVDDYGFYLNVVRRGKIYQMPQRLTVYRRHEGNYSNDDHRVHLALARFYCDFRGQIPLWNFYGWWNYLRSYSWVLRTLGVFYLSHDHACAAKKCFCKARILGWFNLNNWKQ